MLLKNAAATKPRIDRFITRFARVYTPNRSIVSRFGSRKSHP